MTLGGYSDWKLPNVQELLTITDLNGSDYPIYSEFENIDRYGYWSSTEDMQYYWTAWYVDFSIGKNDSGDKSDAYYVRCVRDNDHIFTSFENPDELDFSRDDKNEIVTDNIGKLQWQDDSEAKTVEKTWDEAKKYCESLTLGGYNNWRLPTKFELNSITNPNKYTPAVYDEFKNVVSTVYWSSTIYGSEYSAAWGVDFNYDNDGWFYMSITEFVCCVRDIDVLSVNLQKGWNLVSGDFDINSTDIEYMWKYNNGWSFYSKDANLMQTAKSKGYDIFSDIKKSEGVWIYSNKNLSLTFEGGQQEPIVARNIGWNLLGTSQKMSPSQISCSQGKPLYIWEYENTETLSSWKVYIPSGNNTIYKTLDTIKAGGGFWINCK